MLLVFPSWYDTAGIRLSCSSGDLDDRRRQSPLCPFHPRPIPSCPLPLSWVHIVVVARVMVAPSFSALPGAPEEAGAGPATLGFYKSSGREEGESWCPGCRCGGREPP